MEIFALSLCLAILQRAWGWICGFILIHLVKQSTFLCTFNLKTHDYFASGKFSGGISLSRSCLPLPLLSSSRAPIRSGLEAQGQPNYSVKIFFVCLYCILGKILGVFSNSLILSASLQFRVSFIYISMPILHFQHLYIILFLSTY